MTLGFVTGLPSESKIWRLFESKIQVACCGMGPDAARRAAEQLIRKGVTALISSGIAGGLSPQASVGRLVVASTAVNDDGHVLDCDLSLTSRWQKLMPHALTGRMLTTHHVIATNADKSRLNQEYNAIAVDMESFAVGQVALEYNVPFAILRVVADPYNQTIAPALLRALRDDGTLDIKTVIMALLAKPTLALDAMSLARQSYIAHNQLCSVARIVTDLDRSA